MTIRIIQRVGEMLHVTNGESAAGIIRNTGLAGVVLSWQDVLHEGPVQTQLSPEELNRIRAEFIASKGWGSYQEVFTNFQHRDLTLLTAAEHDNITLWFEHDLFDLLQLLQVLSLLPEKALTLSTLAMPRGDEYLGDLSPARLREVYATRQPLTRAQVALARNSWAAFGAADPSALLKILRKGTQAFPSLGPAFVRHCEQYPSSRNGLNRTERQILETLTAGPMTFQELFLASHHQREELVFMGDTVFADYLNTLGNRGTPLLTWEDGSAITHAFSREFRERKIVLAEAGRSILANAFDLVRTAGIDRWFGGVHLTGFSVPWRWDDTQKALLRTG